MSKFRASGTWTRPGRSVSGVGDVNGDGLDDVLVGASGGDAGGSGSGESYLIYGSTSLPPSIDLRNLGSGGVLIVGASGQDESGYSVGGGGDINGDGFADLIVGAPEANVPSESFSSNGQSYVIFGSPSLPGQIDLETHADVTLVGSRNDAQSGLSVSHAGDVNGDGFDDVIVGSPAGTRGVSSLPNAAHIVFGGESMPSRIEFGWRSPT